MSEFAIGDPNKACGIHEQYLKLYIVIGVLSLLAFVLIVIYLKSKYKKKLLDSLHEMDEKKGYF